MMKIVLHKERNSLYGYISIARIVRGCLSSALFNAAVLLFTSRFTAHCKRARHLGCPSAICYF